MKKKTQNEGELGEASRRFRKKEIILRQRKRVTLTVLKSILHHLNPNKLVTYEWTA